MIQKPIRPWAGVPYTNAEADELTQELNDRTVYGVDGYNSVAEIGAKTQAIESKTDFITVTANVDLDAEKSATALNTAKRSYPIADETRLADTSGVNTGDQSSIVGISGTKAQFDAACLDGSFKYEGDAPTAHTHTASEVTDFDTEVANNSAVAANTAKVGVTNEEENTINSITAGEPTGSDQVINVVSLTQAEYDAGTPVATTFYIITDA